MKNLAVPFLVLALMAPFASCGGGGSTKQTTAIFNHEILTPGGQLYVAKLEIAGATLSCLTYEGSEEVALGSCGIMNARFLTDPDTDTWVEFTDVEIFCNNLTHIWVGYDEGTPAIWTYTEGSPRPPI